uniref:Exostosin GT47 domain-containing protein n=1 Tax=Cannabis sativa TaxID=3483 RepID=A0A803QBD7_CANSA
MKEMDQTHQKNSFIAISSVKNRKKDKDSQSLNKPKRYALMSFRDLPEYMKDNEFILNYYRADWPLKEAFFSLLRWHNETLNVWTHLLGFLLFLGLTMANFLEVPHVVDLLGFFARSLPISTEANVSNNISMGTTKLVDLKQISSAGTEYNNSTTLFGNNYSTVEQWPFFVFLSGSMFCLLSSSICHLFSCHSHSMNIFLLRIDYVGITTMIITSFFPPIYYIFHCDSNWHLGYLGGITAMGIFTIITLLSPRLSEGKFRGFRALLFSSMGLFGIVPTIHALVVNWDNPRRNHILSYELAMAFFYLTGTGFYVSRIPERLKPGWFDLAGHSHQIFHVFVVMGALAHYGATLVILEWRSKFGCVRISCLFIFLLFFSQYMAKIPSQLIIFSLSSSTTNSSSSSIITTTNTTVSGNNTKTNYTTQPEVLSLDTFLSSPDYPNIADLQKRQSNLDKLEHGLVMARAAIREAIVSKTYKSEKAESFVPRGSIYKNSYAFHQSHIEMVKRFKVWSYKEGEPPIFHMAPVNNIYAIEGQFMDEIESEKSPFRATNIEEAHTFFLPLSVSNIVQFIYNPIRSKADYNRDRLFRVVNDYVEVVTNKYPYWNRSNGADHFMVSCHDWAPEISHEKPKLFQYFIRVLCNANISEGFQPKRDVSLPEINLRSTLSPPDLGQVPQNRTILAFFVGRLHGYIRKILFQEWKDKDNDIQVHEKLQRGQNYTKLMGKSKYCLCPSGYEVASPRVVEAINAGCVPVIICDSYSLPFSDVLDWSKFTIQIRPSKIPKLKSILSAIPNEKYLKLYNQVSQVKRHFVLNRPAQPFDVTHMVLHSIWLRRLNVKIGHLNS